MKNDVVILFTRVPVPGKVKTRLQPFLTGEECCALQRAFILDVFGVLLKTGVEIVVSYAPDGDPAELKALLPEARAFFPQSGKALGAKMYKTIRQTLKSGYERCLLVGSDIPLLRAEMIHETFRLLDAHDIVLCPTEDGGYYLIGMNKPAEAVFHINEYGSSTVFEKTLTAAASSGLSCAVGPGTMDIDKPEDLFKLTEKLKSLSPNTCPETRKVLSKLNTE